MIVLNSTYREELPEMHELAVTESILNVVLKNAEASQAKKVIAVGLRIGDMTELQDEWIQRYFDHLSKGTLAEGALLKEVI
jgi:hydrogenase nickel incorporation protein HypA/HybF